MNLNTKSSLDYESGFQIVKVLIPIINWSVFNYSYNFKCFW